jgi:hypothetical protein
MNSTLTPLPPRVPLGEAPRETNGLPAIEKRSGLPARPPAEPTPTPVSRL